MATIYRVIYKNQYQQVTAETNWHTSKNYCQRYIDISYYGDCLSIEEAELIED